MGPRWVGRKLSQSATTEHGIRLRRRAEYRAAMCDTLVSLTDDGVLFAKNSDRDPNEAQVLRWYPAQRARPRRRLSVHVERDRPGAAHLRRPAQPAVVDVGRRDGRQRARRGDRQRGGVHPRRRPERGRTPRCWAWTCSGSGWNAAATAEEAVGVIVELLERHGQGGSCSHEHPRFTYDNSFLVADPDGAFVLETAGRRWATERGARTGPLDQQRAHHPRLRASTRRPGARPGRAVRRPTHPHQAAAERPTTSPAMLAALRDHGGPAPRVVGGQRRARRALRARGRAGHHDAVDRVVGRRPAGGAALHWVTAHVGALHVDLQAGAGRGAGRRWTRRRCPPTRTTRPTAGGATSGCTGWRCATTPAALPGSAPSATASRRSGCTTRPSSAEAFAAADDLEEVWLKDLVDADPTDTRPGWLRRRWRAMDRAAGMLDLAR